MAKSQSYATASELCLLWEKQEGLCKWLGVPLDAATAHLDHIVPVASGGAHTIENLQWVMGSLNRAKSAMSDTEFRTWLWLHFRNSIDPERLHSDIV